tara:strand:- start:226 stop:1389 length:1164 start_codon:yes stop_codon:yes gene_type:complete
MNSSINPVSIIVAVIILIVSVFTIAIITPVGIQVGPIDKIRELSCQNNIEECMTYCKVSYVTCARLPTVIRLIEEAESAKLKEELERAEKETEDAKKEREIEREKREKEQIKDEEEREKREEEERRRQQEEQDRIDAEEKAKVAELKEARKRCKGDETRPESEESKPILFICEPIEQFVLIGGNSEDLLANDENCDKFNKRHTVTRIFFGKYHKHQCAKAIVVFDMNSLNNRLSEGDLIDDAEITFSFTKIKIIGDCVDLQRNGPLEGEKIDLPEEDQKGTPNCLPIDEGDFSSELKYIFSNSPQCGVSDKIFNDLEEWNTIIDWPEYRDSDKMNIRHSIHDDINAGRYLCLAFSGNSSPDKTGDRGQYFSLWAFDDLEIRRRLVDR